MDDPGPERAIPAGGRFAAFPDSAGGAADAARLAARGCRTLSHPSGRPWIVGRWRHSDLVHIAAGPLRLAVIGLCPVTTTELARAAASITRPEQVAALAGRWPGSFHLAAARDGWVWVQGGVAEVRRVFLARTGRGPVAASHAALAAWLSRAPVDEGRLAVRLASPAATPLAELTPWRGVDAVPGGSGLRLDRDGTARTVRWWRPPEATAPLREGAPLLRTALRDAVATRVPEGAPLGADLSGGLDSTSLCFLAAEAGASLVTATIQWTGGGNTDAEWARRAAGRLPLRERFAYRGDALPPFFSHTGRPGPVLDEPLLVRDLDQQGPFLRGMLGHGAVTRLSGLGGDHVVQAPEQYLFALVRRRPATAARTVRAELAEHRWPTVRTLRTLLAPPSHTAWLAGLAGAVRSGVRVPGRLQPWGPVPVLPPWASPLAREAVAALLEERAAAGAGPLDPRPALHARLALARSAGRSAGLVEELYAGVLPTHAPFCDDAVVAASLAVRPEESADPFAYKPLLTAAMAPVVPAGLLLRDTKDSSVVHWYEGLEHNRGALAALAGDSALAALGLVDGRRWREALLSPRQASGSPPAFEKSLALEIWLRDRVRGADDPFPRPLALDDLLTVHPEDLRSLALEERT
ncbi:asparagine synthase-related protein [Streptomyces sp. NPDC001889]